MIAEFENGLARIRHGHRHGSVVHVIRADGAGLVCRPRIGFDSWAPALDTNDPTCGVCIKALRRELTRQLQRLEEQA